MYRARVKLKKEQNISGKWHMTNNIIPILNSKDTLIN